MKNKVLFIAICVVVALTSCQKKGLNLFQGDYSYKTSGSVTITEVPTENDSVSMSFGVDLNNEIGHLEIVTLDKKNDSVLVVMNAMGGKVNVACARVENDKIHFADFPKKLQIISLNPSLELECDVSVRAEGSMYNGNTLLVRMVYEGTCRIVNKEFAIYGADITMAATRN